MVAYLHYLVNPPVGTFDIEIVPDSPENIGAIARSFSDVNQATPFRDTQTLEDSGCSCSSPSQITLSSTVTDLAVDSIAMRSSSSTGLPSATVGPAPQVEQVQFLYQEPGPKGRAVAASIRPGMSGSTSMSWQNFIDDAAHAHLAVTLRGSGD